MCRGDCLNLIASPPPRGPTKGWRIKGPPDRIWEMEGKKTYMAIPEYIRLSSLMKLKGPNLAWKIRTVRGYLIAKLWHLKYTKAILTKTAHLFQDLHLHASCFIRATVKKKSSRPQK